MSQNFMAALIALWAFGDPSMNLLEIRTKFVEQSGYRALVTDAPAGNYSDNGADYYINSGIRWLMRRIEGWAQRMRYSTALDAGEYVIDIPNVNTIRNFRVRDSANKTYGVAFRTLDQLRYLYGNTEFGDIAPGRPKYWTWYEGATDGDNAIVDPQFALGEGTYADSMPDASGKWSESGAKWSISGGIATGTMTADPNPIYDGVIYNTLPIEAIFPHVGRPSSVAVDVTVSGYSGAFAGFYVMVGWTGEMPDGSGVGQVPGGFGYALLPEYQAGYPVPSKPIAVGSTVRFVIDGLAWPEPFYNLNWIQLYPLIYGNEADAEIRISKVELRTEFAAPQSGNVLVVPPADADYTVDVWGAFGKTELSADTDSNWWTEQHPEFAIRAARLQLEMDGHRNVSGAEAFQKQLETELYRLQSEHSYAWVAGLAPEETVPNG